MSDLQAERDALVMVIMRGSHREARDMARARFVEMCPEERGHAEKVARDAKRIAALTTANERVRVLEDALGWYEEQVAGCRKIGSSGVPYQNALHADGGKRARAALTPSKGGE